MKNARAYQDYSKIIPHLSECSDETLKEIVQEMRNLCGRIINVSKLLEYHNNKIDNYFDEDLLKIYKEFDFKPVNELDRVEMLTELCFEVNKVTKDINLNDLGKIVFRNAERKRPKLNITGIKEVLSTKYRRIYENLNSKTKDKRRKGIEDYLKLDNDDENVFDFFYEYTTNTEYWYKIKNDLIFQIIKELANNPEKYQNYAYGFMMDKIEKESGEIIDVPLFGINIPGHEGTYQFHLLKPKEAVFDLETILKVPHPASELVRGNRQINRKQWHLTINDIPNIKDIEKLEEDLEDLKQIAKKYTNVEEIKEDKENVFRKIHYISALLRKNLKQQLLEVSDLAANTYITDQQLFIENSEKKEIKTETDKEKYEDIINTVRKYKRIFYSSESMDSKVAVETIKNKVVNIEINAEIRRRQIIEKEKKDGKEKIELTKEEIEKIRDSIKIYRINPGTAPDSDDTKKLKEEEKGLYVNTSKNGYYKKKVLSQNTTFVGKDAEKSRNTNLRKPISEMIKLNVDENMRETSICGLLSRFGFKVPKDVIKYANDVSAITTAIGIGSRNAYLLANSLDGEKIIKLCDELEKKGENLISASLTDEQIDRYGVREEQQRMEKAIEEDKKKLEYIYFIEDENKQIQVVHERKDKNGNVHYTPECEIDSKKIKRKLLINKDEDPEQVSFYVGYAEGADYGISINETEQGGVQLAIQSNPAKSDLPWKLRKWAYNKTKYELQDPTAPINDVEDILNEKTRIIIGGLTKNNIYLKDRRKNKEGSYKYYTINKIISLIKEDEEEKINEKHFENILDKLLETLDKGKNIER